MGKVHSFRGKDAEFMAPLLRDAEVEKMSEKWEHLACEDCYHERRPGKTGRPVRANITKNEPAADCCYCGEETDSGILLRSDPAVTNCQGITGIHI